MSFELGNNLRISVSGASHSEFIEVRITGLPKGYVLNKFDIEDMLKRRQGGGAFYATARKESDEPVYIKGVENDTLSGEELVVRFYNKNARSSDYDNMKYVPRPGHADFVAYEKYKGKLDMAGGGFFSGRMTLPMVFAGAVVKGLLEDEGILVGAHISSVGGVCDDRYDKAEDLLEVNCDEFPVLNKEAGDEMLKVMREASLDGDSVGGSIECKITGLPVGLGDPIYDSLESRISYGIFGIPAVKGIEFGQGFGVTSARGSESNDPFIIKDGKVKCMTNNSGGIQGGMTNGMPVVFNVAIKPTPSIYKEQNSVDLVSMKEEKLVIKGRHDSCIVPRALPCVEAMAMLIIYDSLIEYKNFVRERDK